MANNLEVIAPAALIAQRATGCPGLLLIAQCALETGWLKSAPGNNCFGIKTYPGCFGEQLLNTTEWFTDSELAKWQSAKSGRMAALVHPVQTDARGRHKYVVKDWFATFNTLGDCFSKRAEMWDKGPYFLAAQAYKQDADLAGLVKRIAPIYATDPEYARQVMGIITQSNVQEAWRKVCQQSA